MTTGRVRGRPSPPADPPGARPGRRLLLHKLRGRTGDHIYWQVPYGLYVLASYLRSHSAWEVVVTDEAAEADPLEALIERYQPAVLGLSANSVDMRSLDRHWQSGTLPRFLAAGGWVLLGGPHATVAPHEVTRYPGTIFVRHEGEQTLVELLEAYEVEAPVINELSGIAYADGARPVLTPPRGFLAGDDIPSPLWPKASLPPDHCNPIFYQGRRTQEIRSGPVMTSRGCPYSCSFCHATFGRKVRRRPVERVIRDMEEAVQGGAAELYLLDDFFLPDSEDLHQLLAAVSAADLGVPISFYNGLRADGLTARDLEQLYAAGGRHISLPIDSAVPRILALMKKPLDLERARESWRIARELGFLVQTNIIFGWPGATEQELQREVDFVAQGDLHCIHAILPVITAGNDLYRQAVSRDPDLEAGWHDYADTQTPRNLTACSDAVFRELKQQLDDIARERLQSAEARARLSLFNLEPNPDFIDGLQKPPPERPAAVPTAPAEPALPPELLPRAELQALIAPLRPRKPLPRGWEVGRIHYHLDGWPVIELRHPGEGRRVRLQLGRRGAFPSSITTTKHYCLRWLPDGDETVLDDRQQLFVTLLVKLIEKNDHRAASLR